jgi:hypothetical protein
MYICCTLGRRAFLSYLSMVLTPPLHTARAHTARVSLEYIYSVNYNTAGQEGAHSCTRRRRAPPGACPSQSSAGPGRSRSWPLPSLAHAGVQRGTPAPQAACAELACVVCLKGCGSVFLTALGERAVAGGVFA